MTTILPPETDLFHATRIHRAAERQAILDEATQLAEAQILDAGYEFVTGILGKQLAAEKSIFDSGIALYVLRSGSAESNVLLTKEQARGLRNYLATLDLDD